MRGLGYTNHVGREGVWDVCLGCGGEVGVEGYIYIYILPLSYNAHI